MPLIDAEALHALALALTRRHMRLCKQAPRCPVCRTRQVQLIDCAPLAAWKCRHCNYCWRFEPLALTEETPMKSPTQKEPTMLNNNELILVLMLCEYAMDGDSPLHLEADTRAEVCALHQRLQAEWLASNGEPMDTPVAGEGA